MIETDWFCDFWEEVVHSCWWLQIQNLIWTNTIFFIKFTTAAAGHFRPDGYDVIVLVGWLDLFELIFVPKPILKQTKYCRLYQVTKEE